MLEALPGTGGDLALVYRVRHDRDIVFREEIDRLARSRGARVHVIVGGRKPAGSDALDAAGLQRLVPDIRERDVYLCGPVGMMQRVVAALAELRVPRRQVHAERFND